MRTQPPPWLKSYQALTDPATYEKLDEIGHFQLLQLEAALRWANQTDTPDRSFFVYRSGWFVELTPMSTGSIAPKASTERVDGRTHYKRAQKRAEFVAHIRRLRDNLVRAQEEAVRCDVVRTEAASEKRKLAIVNAWCADREEILNLLLQASGQGCFPELRDRCWAMLQKHGADAKIELKDEQRALHDAAATVTWNEAAKQAGVL